jgi:CheY-like chemotaxis protein
MSLAHARILVVEDSEEVRELIVLLLEGEGFSVDSCEDADQALAKVRRERPDLILTDLMLGATSGLDLITRIRSDLAPPVPPIVVCSGFTGFEREALQRGAEAFIPKPFEHTTIHKTVTSILARERLSAKEREEAAKRSRLLRARAIEAAKVAVSRFEQIESLEVRNRATVNFLPRYFGFGEAFGAVLEGGELRVRASSNEQCWRPGQALDLALCRDILETSSALVVPDLRSLGAVVRGPDGKVLRFFAGVPMFSGSISVGTCCLVDEAPRGFGADAYSLLATFARRASAIMSGHESEVAPFWTPSGLMTREGLCTLLTAELARMEREAISLRLLLFVGHAPGVQRPARTAIADLGDGRCAAIVTRESKESARQVLRDLVGTTIHADDFAGGSLVVIEDGAGAYLDARGILRAAENLLESSQRTAPGTIEQVLIRRGPPAL